MYQMSSFGVSIRYGLSLMKREDDDTFDRLSWRYSVGICLVLASIFGAGIYIDPEGPIKCWTPKEFSHDHWQTTVDQYCWVMNTYYVAPTERIPDHNLLDEAEIKYYQWTPILMVCQAFLFTLPGVLWMVISSNAGLSIDTFVKKCTHPDNIDPSKRDEVIKHLRDYLHRYLKFWRADLGMTKLQRQLGSSKRKRKGNYLVNLYMLTKLCYIGGAVIQLVGFNYIIKENFHSLAISEMGRLWMGNMSGDSHLAKVFPLHTLCNFKVPRLGSNVHTYTIPCVLPWNMYNEKIYLFLWWWLVFIVAVSTLGIFLWARTLTSSSSKKFITYHLKLATKENMDLKRVDEFTGEYMDRNGMFVLRMISKHVPDMFTAQLVLSMWNYFIEYYEALDTVLDKLRYSEVSTQNEEDGSNVYPSGEGSVLLRRS